MGLPRNQLLQDMGESNGGLNEHWGASEGSRSGVRALTSRKYVPRLEVMKRLATEGCGYPWDCKKDALTRNLPEGSSTELNDNSHTNLPALVHFPSSHSGGTSDKSLGDLEGNFFSETHRRIGAPTLSPLSFLPTPSFQRMSGVLTSTSKTKLFPYPTLETQFRS